MIISIISKDRGINSLKNLVILATISTLPRFYFVDIIWQKKERTVIMSLDAM